MNYFGFALKFELVIIWLQLYVTTGGIAKSAAFSLSIGIGWILLR